MPESLKVLGRDGEKKFNDRFAPYIRRIYDGMESNEYWVADTHTLDVISSGEGGKEHRLYLVAFFDARSGVFTGCHITEQPSSQATLYALRKGILRYGIPAYIYVDNGREFLTYDVGGLGHRAHKKNEEEFTPPPVFERLGITMVNALVRNAKAKIIERRFRDVKEHLSRLFPTYTGGNILERPEQLKYNLKAGKIVADRELTETVELLLYHYFNEQAYGGAVVKDRGKPRMRVYHENLHTKRLPKCEEDLNLLMMRSSRPQKVGRRGINFTVGDIQLDYWTPEFLAAMEGEKVYYRYDPENLSTVRVYSCPDDRYLATVPTDNVAVLKYGSGVDELKEAQRKVHSFARMQKKALEELRGAVEDPISHLELAKRKAQRNQNLDYLPNSDLVTEYVSIDETPLLGQAVGYDLDTMIRSSEERQRIQTTGGYDDE
ncbi:MAG: Mu transposase C-terminal domain-containing protein [Oscillospiraceae bacterium]